MSASLVISFDFELGWGVLENNGWIKRESKGVYKDLRIVLPEVISKLKEQEIATTWAVVSNLLADKVADLDVHHLPDKYKDDAISFFQDSEFESHNGVDILEQLLSDLGPLCEVASHTASHLYQGHPEAKSKHIVDDIEASIHKLQEFSGRNVSSLVFPRDQAGYRFEVAKKKPLTMRINPDWWSGGGQASRIYKGGKRLFGMVPQSKIITGSNGLVFQTGSLNFNAASNRFSQLKKYVLLSSVSSLCKKLEDGNGAFHIWLHPFNLSESPFVYEIFMRFLNTVGSLQQRGVVEVLTMEKMASRANFCI